MRKAVYILAAVCAAALLAGALWYFYETNAYLDFDWRLIIV